MKEETAIIKNFAVFNDEETHRYVLCRIWDEKKPISLFVSKMSGQADGIFLELTNSLITNNLYKLGYGGYYTVNLCSGIHGKTDEVKDKETDVYISEYAKKSSEVIISWGTLNTNKLREREIEVLKLIKAAKKRVLAVSDNSGRTNIHVLTPSVRNGFSLSEVNIKEIISEREARADKQSSTVSQ